MLKGKTITLRPVHDTDLDQLHAYHLDIDNRGDFFPRSILPQPLFRKQFQESGFWGQEDGMMVIVSAQDEIVGHIEFFKTVNYLDEYELFSVNGTWIFRMNRIKTCSRPFSIIGGAPQARGVSYQIYVAEQRNQGAATEAVTLLVRYLFENKRVNRIRLVIHLHNLASRRLAEKCGFRHEGAARGAWYHQGIYQDVEICAVLHGDV